MQPIKTVLVSAVVLATGCSAPLAEESPRLVLQITVDQLRGDMPFAIDPEKLTDGGFRWLIENGTVYRDAHHAHANTETIVGHATLATGAHPREHGMVGNIWFDRETGTEVYNIEDPAYSLLTADAGVDADTEIDPTQRVAKTDGRSPNAILTTTFSDELAKATLGEAKIFGVSVKDRGAVSMAGHAGKAFWFSKASGEFVTSTYYYDAYPDWVSTWNASGKVAAYGNTDWALSGDKAGYAFGARDDQPWETDVAGFGRTFPHPYGDPDSPYFTTLLTLSPAGDALTLDFAKTLIDAEAIGEDAITDYLSVSFSATDYVGHVFGPSSLESEDNLLRLDAAIAGLLAHVDAKVGLDKTLVVLSADHGAAEAPGHLATLGIPGDTVDPETWDTAPALAALKERFGIGAGLIEKYSHPYVNLDRAAIAKAGLDLADVQRAVAAELLTFDSVFAAVPSTDLADGRVPDTEISQAIVNNYNPARSGDIYLVFKPNHFIADFDGLTVSATHGSPWTYDTHVPIIFAGHGIRARTIHRPAETVQIAPTLSALVGAERPSGARAPLLSEVLNGER